jgi:hypothetical protein
VRDGRDLVWRALPALRIEARRLIVAQGLAGVSRRRN